MEFVFLLLGIIGLLLGAQLVVKASKNLADYYKISPLFLGLTILTIGTNLPELVVSMTAAYQKVMGIDTSGIVMGNIIGSGMGQISFTLGFLGLFATISLTKRRLSRDGFAALISVVLLFLASWDGVVTRLEGVQLIIIYIIYFLIIYREEKVTKKVRRTEKVYPVWILMSLLGGLAILVFSSHVVVEYSMVLAESWDVSQAWIGMIIIGFATSLPELAVAVSAIRSGVIGLSVGNLVGSNVFDLLFVLGGVAVISEISVEHSVINFYLPFLFLTSLLVLYFFRTRMKLQKKEAIVLLLMYGFYFGFTIFLGLVI